MAPHINVAIFARGINIHLNTRIYFADEAEANAKDPVLRPDRAGGAPPDAARPPRGAGGRSVYRFDIRLQGDDETVFFDV